MPEPHLTPLPRQLPFKGLWGVPGPTNTAQPTLCNIQLAAQCASAQSHTTPFAQSKPMLPRWRKTSCAIISQRAQFCRAPVPRPTEVPIQKPRDPFTHLPAPGSCQQWLRQQPSLQGEQSQVDLGPDCWGPPLLHPSLRFRFLRTESGGGGYYASQGSRKCQGHVLVRHPGRGWQWLLGLIVGPPELWGLDKHLEGTEAKPPSASL